MSLVFKNDARSIGWRLRKSKKYGSVTNCLETMTKLNDYVLEGGAFNQVQRIIGQKFFLKSDINFMRQFFYQTEF
jgi:hypothetical protein